MTDESVAAVRATVDRAIQTIGTMQGAIGLAQGRGQEAVDIIRIASRGAADDQPASALAMMANADRLCEEAITSTLAATEALMAWQARL